MVRLEHSDGMAADLSSDKKFGRRRVDPLVGLVACDALIVGSPVYYANMAGEIKTFFDNWLLKFRFAFTDFKMRNKNWRRFRNGRSDFERQGNHNAIYPLKGRDQSLFLIGTLLSFPLRLQIGTSRLRRNSRTRSILSHRPQRY
jgi:NADPH-dependent FMN reductase